MKTEAKLGALLVMALLMAVSGCHVEKTQHADGKDVKIETPFGGMSVKTDASKVQAETGLAVYPGALPEKKKDEDHQSADVNMNFGNFHLGIKAASYTTPDSPAQVMSFYRGQLGHFGAVLECRGKQTVGSPAVTEQGLRCDEGRHGKVSVTDHEDDLELKAGSPQHQHIVGIQPQGAGTKFGLVLLDLPGDLHFSDDSKQ